MGIHFHGITKVSRTGRRVVRFIRFLGRPTGCRGLKTGVPGKTVLDNPPKAKGALLTGTATNRTKIPFLSISKDRFIRVFININSSQIESLFGRTQRVTPYVMFVSRVSTVNGTHNHNKCLKNKNGSRERDALGRLLIRVSNFNSASRVIILTNAGHPSMLSPTLAQPNHFSEVVTVSGPSLGNQRSVFTIRLAPVGARTRSGPLLTGGLTFLAPNFTKTSVTGIYGRTTLVTTHLKSACIRRGRFRVTVRQMITKLRGGSQILSPRRGGVITCRRTNRTITN